MTYLIYVHNNGVALLRDYLIMYKCKMHKSAYNYCAIEAHSFELDGWNKYTGGDGYRA